MSDPACIHCKRPGLYIRARGLCTDCYRRHATAYPRIRPAIAQAKRCRCCDKSGPDTVCPDCRTVFVFIEEAHALSGRQVNSPPHAQLGERIERYAARAASGQPLFEEAGHAG